MSVETEAMTAIEARVEGARVLEHRDREAWVAALMQTAEVIGPVRAEGGDEMFAPLGAPGELLWDFVNPLGPPKQFLLPQTDPLLGIRPGERGIEITPIHDDRPRVLMNVRSCDATAFGFLHRVHACEPADDAYLRREQRVTLVTLSCTQPCPLGFCLCSNAGPFLERDYDLQLTDLGSALLAEPGSDRGRELLAAHAAAFRPARAADLEQRLEREQAARRSFGPETCHFASAMRRISTGRVAETLWREIAEWCLECGGCNFVCPTCYCFSVKDRRDDGGWTRCRIWDSCQYAAFTMEASGHNPRAAHGERVKRRFFHKVSAQHYVRDGMVGCVGCGRCVKVCMGTTDMPAVVRAVRRGAWHG